MKTIPLCTADIKKLVQSGAKPKNFDLPSKLQFEVGLEVDDDTAKDIELNDKLANTIFKTVSKEYDACKTKVINRTKFCDAQIASAAGPVAKLKKQWETDVKGYFDEASKAMDKAAQKAVKDYIKTKTDRKKYVVKTAAKITVGSLGLATASLGTVVAAAAGGPGVAVAIYGNVKALVNLLKELKKLAQDMEAAEKSLIKHMGKLAVTYKDATKAQVNAREIAAALIEQVTTKSKVSISVVESELKTFQGKLAGIDVKANDAGKKIHKILDQQTELDKKILDKAEKELSTLGYTSKKLPKLQKKMDKVVEQTKELISSTEELYKRVDVARGREKGHVQAVASLKSKKSDWVKWAEASVKLVDLGLGAAFTTYTAAEQVLVLVDSVMVEIDDLLVEELEG